MLTTQHRDHDFTVALRDAFETVVKGHIHQRRYFSLSINFKNVLYLTDEHLRPAC